MHTRLKRLLSLRSLMGKLNPIQNKGEVARIISNKQTILKR